MSPWMRWIIIVAAPIERGYIFSFSFIFIYLWIYGFIKIDILLFIFFLSRFNIWINIMLGGVQYAGRNQKWKMEINPAHVAIARKASA